MVKKGSNKKTLTLEAKIEAYRVILRILLLVVFAYAFRAVFGEYIDVVWSMVALLAGVDLVVVGVTWYLTTQN